VEVTTKEKLKMKVLKKSLMVAALSLGLAFVGSNAFAADLGNLNGQSCTGDGSWHFVNNQTGKDVPAGRIAVYFTPAGNDQSDIGPSAVNKNNQHFNVYTVGAATLTGASTTLAGKLVLSSFTCDVKEPPCDPKNDPKCEI
jgi:hypothetical protein